TLNPPISQANSQQPIHITGNLSNMGNLSIPAAQLQLTVTVGDTTPPSALPTPPVALTTFYASSNGIAGMAQDPQGNVYVLDSTPDDKIFKVAPDKSSTLIKVLPSSATVNGTTFNFQPAGLARDPSGNLWIMASVRLLARLDTSGNFTYFDTGLPTLHNLD